MKNGVDITCVVPVKNGGEWLAPCLDSLLYQQFTGSFEVCIFDDGSTDETPAVIAEYASKFAGVGIPCITRRSDLSGGVGAGKNGAASLGSGRFLAFCDADDVSGAERLQELHRFALSLRDPDSALLGSRFSRDPPGSTERFTRWANEMSDTAMPHQIFTSHGPPVVAPTWFVARALYERVGGFKEVPKGFPEDTDFFYRALDAEATVSKVDVDLVTYRYHVGCETFSVKEETIWLIRLAELERRVLGQWDSFTVWSAGKQGKRFFKSLSPSYRSKVRAFCDVDGKKIGRGIHEEFDPETRRVTHRIPIVGIRDAQPPLIICVKQDLTQGDLENFIAEKNLVEGKDYFHFG